jgi:hypothetical protein
MVRPAENADFAIHGQIGGWKYAGFSHRPVKTVSHAPRNNVAYHSPACINKGPRASEYKEHSEK